MANKKSMRWYDWVFSLLISVALINWGTLAWFNLDLVDWMTFGISWLAKTIYTIVSIFGLIGLWTLITKLLLNK